MSRMSIATSTAMRATRRQFLKATSATTAALWLPVPRWAPSPVGPSILVPALGHRLDPDLHDLATRAVDAAMAAGATYADVRLTVTREERISNTIPVTEEATYGLGVRVLVNGFWGFMASAVWTPEEAVRLARGAVAQGKANGAGKTQTLDLGPAIPVATGDWVMPVRYDPFDIPLGEKTDVLGDIIDVVRQSTPRAAANISVRFQRQHKVFASSDGSAWTQTTYVSNGMFGIQYRDQYSLRLPQGVANANFLTGAGRGWEYISESGLIDAIPGLIDQAEQSRHRVPVEPDRFDVVCGAHAMAMLLDATIGAASELDRALGYEANASGTSYLNDPLNMLGAYQVGSSHLNVIADRSTPGAIATVKWDDESVTPETFQLVENGILVDYQTTREQAPWLASYYQRTNRPIRSHGCAGAGSALDVTLQQPPNLQILPGPTERSFEELVAATEKGIAIVDIGGVSMDQQQLNGVAYPILRKITKGKLGPFVVGGAIVFRAPELWKSLTAVGGPKSVQWFGASRQKGQPAQLTMHSVAGVPGKFTNVSIVDFTRKA